MSYAETLSYKNNLSDWTNRVVGKWKEYLPETFSLNNFTSQLKSVSNDVAYGIALGLKQAIENFSLFRKQETTPKYVRMRTHQYSDGSVRIYDPWGKTYAYYGTDSNGQPFYHGEFDPDKIGRSGFLASGGVFDQLADRDPLNYNSGKHFKFKKA